MTPRNGTARAGTVTIGTNAFIGTDPALLLPALETLFADEWKEGRVPDLWDGRAAERIVTAPEHLLAQARA